MLLCTKCGPVDKTLSSIDEGEPMQCASCLDFTVELIEEAPLKEYEKYE